MKSRLLALSIALVACFSFSNISALAEETVGEKIGDSTRATNSKTKKSWRKTKKGVRDATGNGSVSEDVKDSARNAGDAIDDSAKRLKNKVD